MNPLALGIQALLGQKNKWDTQLKEQDTAQSNLLTTGQGYEDALKQLGNVKFNEPAKRQPTKEEMIYLVLGEALKGIVDQTPRAMRQNRPSLLDQFGQLNEMERQRMLEAEARRVDNERNTLLANAKAQEAALGNARTVYGIEEAQTGEMKRQQEYYQERADQKAKWQEGAPLRETQLRLAKQDVTMNQDKIDKALDPIGYATREKRRLESIGYSGEDAHRIAFKDQIEDALRIEGAKIAIENDRLKAKLSNKYDEKKILSDLATAEVGRQYTRKETSNIGAGGGEDKFGINVANSFQQTIKDNRDWDGRDQIREYQQIVESGKPKKIGSGDSAFLVTVEQARDKWITLVKENAKRNLAILNARKSLMEIDPRYDNITKDEYIKGVAKWENYRDNAEQYLPRPKK